MNLKAIATAAITSTFAYTASANTTDAPNFTPEELETITFVKNFNECMATGDNDPDRAAQIQAYNAEIERAREHNNSVVRQFNADEVKYDEAYEQYMWDSPMVDMKIKLESRAYDFPQDSTSRLLLLRQANALQDEILKDFQQTTGLTKPHISDYEFQEVTLPKPIDLDLHCTLKYAGGQIIAEDHQGEITLGLTSALRIVRKHDSLKADISGIILKHGGKAYMDAIGIEMLPAPTPAK